jgi:hypothetical protein
MNPSEVKRTGRCAVPGIAEVRLEHHFADAQWAAGDLESGIDAEQIDAVAVHRHDSDLIEGDIELAELPDAPIQSPGCSAAFSRASPIAGISKPGSSSMPVFWHTRHPRPLQALQGRCFSNEPRRTAG